MSVSRPRIKPVKAQPQMARRGIEPKRCEMGLKNLLKGKAPSREKAQVWREAATSCKTLGYWSR